MMAASPGEFGCFWKELLEKATKEQRDAAIAAAPPGVLHDLSIAHR